MYEQGAVSAGVLKSSLAELGRSGVSHPTVENGDDGDEVGPASQEEGPILRHEAASERREASATQGVQVGPCV